LHKTQNMNAIKLKKLMFKLFWATLFFLFGFMYAQWQIGKLDDKWDRIELIGAFQFIILLLIVELMIGGMISIFNKKEEKH
jgi:uncharacterized membrane protein YcjF (UPF0283 family)